MSPSSANFDPTRLDPPMPVRLGAISFINTIPVYHGFNPGTLPFSVELTYDAPAELNAAVGRQALDVSPVSSAYYLAHQDDLILLEDLSVSSFGAVESVLFLSKEPVDSGAFLSQTPAIAVPDDSETSINLLAWLLSTQSGASCRERFRVYAANDYEAALAEFGAVLIIGDNALRIHENPAISQAYHIHDLSSAWVAQTQLPFVFAVWVAQKSWAIQNPGKLHVLNQALIESRRRFLETPGAFDAGVTSALAQCRIPEPMIRRYFTEALDYRLTAAHQASLSRFESVLQTLNSQKDMTCHVGA